MLKTSDKPHEAARLRAFATFVLMPAAAYAVATGTMNYASALFMAVMLLLLWGQHLLASELVKEIRRRVAKAIDPPNSD